MPSLSWRGWRYLASGTSATSFAGRPAEFVALRVEGQWHIYRTDEAPAESRYGVDLIEIRPGFGDDERLSIAVLDDSHQAADELARSIWVAAGFNAVAFYDVDSFYQALQQSLFDGYVVDWLIGEETADRCIATIRASDNPDAPVLVLTGELGTDRRESEISSRRCASTTCSALMKNRCGSM